MIFRDQFPSITSGGHLDELMTALGVWEYGRKTSRACRPRRTDAIIRSEQARRDPRLTIAALAHGNEGQCGEE